MQATEELIEETRVVSCIFRRNTGLGFGGVGIRKSFVWQRESFRLECTITTEWTLMVDEF